MGEKELKVLIDGDMKADSGAGVDGVYAVGEMNSDGSSNVVHALWSAKRGVVAIHGELGREIFDEAAVADDDGKAGSGGGGKGMRKREVDEVDVVEETWEGEKKRLAALLD